ncbi:unnamed protein product [Linum trigynum]|uniref:Uncharacterized protein n=1 Tax=Linum trigynum TaxID=586398 RepID=A0AAV2FVU6_9ROSI
MGVEMCITEKVLAEVLETTNLRKRIDVFNAWNETHFSRAKQIQTVCGLAEEEDAEDCSRPTIRELTVKVRVLNHMLSYNILPKGGHREAVTYFDIELLINLLSHEKVNLPYLIFTHMLAVAENSNRNLPYGMILTLLFDHFNVDLSGEVGLRVSRQEFYTVTYLKKMEIELHDGEYVRAYNPHVVHGGDVDDDVDDNEELEDEPMVQPHSSTPLVTLQHIWDSMDGMYDYMGQMSIQMIGMYDYMGQMTTQMSTLQLTVTEMRDEFHSFI